MKPAREQLRELKADRDALMQRALRALCRSYEYRNPASLDNATLRRLNEELRSLIENWEAMDFVAWKSQWRARHEGGEPPTEIQSILGALEDNGERIINIRHDPAIRYALKVGILAADEVPQ